MANSTQDLNGLFESWLSPKSTANSMRKRVMNTAWRRAKFAAKRFGGKASDYISSTMKTAWETQRSITGQVKRGGDLAKKKMAGEPMNASTAELNVLLGVLRDAQAYGDINDSDGAVLESMNASRVLEFIEDLRLAYGDQWIVDNIKKSGKSIRQIAEDLVVIVRAHYDDAYASWAGGTENFKSALRQLQIALAGSAGEDLINIFFA